MAEPWASVEERAKHLGVAKDSRGHSVGVSDMVVADTLELAESMASLQNPVGAIAGSFDVTGLVPRFPTAFLALGIMVMVALSLTSGVVLDTVTRGRREVRMLAYLQIAIEEQSAIERR